MNASSSKLNLRVLSMVVVLIVMSLFFRLEVGDFYFSGESIAKLFRDMVSWTILAAGMTLVIVSGQIDLSVGSLLALAAASCALMVNPDYGYGMSATVAVPVAIVIAMLLGALQGTLTAYFRIPSFIVTLGGLFVFRGITEKVSEFDPRVPGTSWILSIGFDYLSPFTGWIIGTASCAVVSFFLIRSRLRKRRMGIASDSATMTVVKIGVTAAVVLGFVAKVNEYKGIPVQTIAMAVVLIALYVVAQHTKLGRHLYAIGGNVEAARLSGIKVERRIVTAFTIMGMLAGVAGVIWMAQNTGSTKNAGQFYELYAIAATVIGGTSLMGGRGTIFGTFLGGLLMATVIQGMDYTNLENWLQLVVRGGVVVIAVGIDIATKNPPEWLRRIWHHQRLT